MADQSTYSDPIQLSDRTAVVIAPLNVDEMIQADMFAPEGAPAAALNKIYAICGIRKIKQGTEDFVDVAPLSSRPQMRALGQRLNAAELLKLQIEQGRREESSFSDELKNDLAALQQRAS